MMAEPGRDATPLFKKKPTVALFSLDQEGKDILQDGFKQFGIDVIVAADTAVLYKEKLEGCVVSLANPVVEKIVAEARHSAWQKRMVIYAIGPVSKMRSLTRYGINVLLDAPLTRAAAIKAIHATRLLLLNELRRYVRLPLAAPVALEYGSRRSATTSIEISAGGMSLQWKEAYPPLNTTVCASFAVPGSEEVNMASVVCWCDEKAGYIGLRFDPAAEGRQAVRAWIEDYLGLD